MNFQLSTLTIENGLAHFMLNRPKVLNALNLALVGELREALDLVRKSAEARVVIISGSAGNFAAGADITGMVDQSPIEAGDMTFNAVFNAIEDFPLPVIAAIAGYALGGGLELAMACDMRICGRDAKLGLPEIKLGIFPGAGGTQRLPRLVGAGRAKEMIFLGEFIDAQTALAYGLCNRVADGDPVEEAVRIAKKLIERSPVALRYAKGVVNYGSALDLRAGIAHEEKVWAGLFSTQDQKEGMKAFIEKRKPNFTGR